MDNENVLGHVEKTMHYYKRLHMDDVESVDDCGTCDGACCDNCRTIYVVEDWSNDSVLYHGPDKKKAIEIAGYDFTH